MYLILLWALVGLIGQVHSKCTLVSSVEDERTIAYVCTEGTGLADLNDVTSDAEWIEFSISRFPYIPDNAFSRFPNLRRLIFYNCRIQLISGDAFAGLHRLEWLRFHGTKIHAVRAAWLRHLPNLRRLSFDKADLVYIEPETFRMVPRLEVLELNDNDLDCLPIDQLAHLRSLKIVRVANNPWLCECQRRLNEFFRERSVAQEAYCGGGVTLCASYQCMTQIRLPVLPLAWTTHHVATIPATSRLAWSRNRFETSDLSSLSRLPDTTSAIEIYRVPIDNIPRYTFFRFGNSLRSLNIMDCGLTSIEVDAFAGLYKLERLSLTGNRFTTVGATWFRGLTGLQQLVLQRNAIREVERTAFWHLAGSLKDLDIRNNQLRCLAIEELSELRHLQRVNATGNFWNCICLRNLQRFLSERNIGYEITSTCYDAESEIPSWITQQPSTSTTTGMVHWISFEESIRDLNLTVRRPTPTPPRPRPRPIQTPAPPVYTGNCHQDKVDGTRGIYTCSGITSLEELTVIPRTVHTIRVIQSSIGSIPENAFDRFNGYLSRLELRNCGIKKLAKGAFGGLYNLEYLSLHGNQLDSFSSEMTEGLSHLRHLDVSRNRIDRIANDVFKSLPYLLSLDVSENMMNCIGVEYIEHTLHYLKTFSVAGNPWSCLCGTKLVDYLQKHGMRYDINPGAIDDCYSSTITTTHKTTTMPSLIATSTAAIESAEGSCTVEESDMGPRYRCVGGNLPLLRSISEKAIAIEFLEGHLPKLSAGSFARFGDLEELVIRNSGLLVIENNAFEGLYSLENLTIQDNPLKSVEVGAFTLKDLERLDLRGNSINHIAPGAFRSLERLAYLNLEGNDFKCIFTSDLNDMPNVHIVEFSGNPLKWRCRVELEEFLQMRQIKYVRVENSCEGKKLVRNLLLQNQTDLQSLSCTSECSAVGRPSHYLVTIIVAASFLLMWT